MLKRKPSKPAIQKPVRLWPGIIAAIFILLLKYIIPKFAPDALPIALLGGALFGLVVIIWWAFFSRAPRIERWGVVLLMILALVAVKPFLHKSIAEAGMGIAFFIFSIPIMSAAFVLGAVISRRFSPNLRRLTLAVIILISVFGWTLIRTGGIDNGGNSEFTWRWTQTSEERLLTQVGEQLTILQPVAPIIEAAAVWPGFRGTQRDGIVHGTFINNDWTANPPRELWRRMVGPGWSSFSVRGDLFYTQEQRGDEEIVSCYNINTGEPVWLHSDKARFWESNAGAGPRGTPTLSNGRVYTLGATGILNVLNANDGSVVWSRNAASDVNTKIPMWGISGSPLVVDSTVIVAAAGSLVGYDLVTGNMRWSQPAGVECYSSPHLLNLGGITQILFQNDTGTISVTPADGKLLWHHEWKGNPIVQPAMTADGDILISTSDRSGIRRIKVAPGTGGWITEELWTSTRIKPYFNDSAIHKGHVYGFDGPFLACIDITNGERTWKGGRYGRGQFILLPDQDLLLVLSEKGELALVNAVPDQFTELARIPAIEGKTWNHPVLAGDVLLIRNGSEMAAFRLALDKE